MSQSEPGEGSKIIPTLPRLEAFGRKLQVINNYYYRFHNYFQIGIIIYKLLLIILFINGRYTESGLFFSKKTPRLILHLILSENSHNFNSHRNRAGTKIYKLIMGFWDSGILG